MGQRSALLPATGAKPDLAALYRAHAPTVSIWIRRLGGAHVDVDDLLHDVFLTAQRRLPGFRGEAEVTTWLYAIAVRVVWNRRRKDRFWQRLAPFGGASTEAVDSGLTPLEATEQRDAARVVYRLLDGLAEKDRTVLILFEFEKLSGEEIAPIIGTSVANVWVRLHRARDRLRAAFGRWEKRNRL